MRKSFLTGLALILMAGAAAADTIAIRGGKVWTGTEQGTLENATVVIVDGVVTAVGGATAQVPGDATIIEADGKWVTPGLFVPFSRVGLVDVGAEGASNDENAGGSPYSVALDASDGFNPDAVAVDITRIEGVTRMAVAPQTGSNIFGGQGFVTDTSGDVNTKLRERAFLYVDLSEGGAARAGGSRSAAWAQLRAALDDARFFTARYMAHSEGSALNRVDAQAFGPAARGQQLVLVKVHKARDILNVLELAEQNKNLKLAILGADEGWRVADSLAQSNVPVIIEPFSNLPSRFETLGATSENAARLIKAGAIVAFAHFEDDGHQSRLITQVAGNAVANGVAHDDAMKAMTTVPAQIYGLEGFGQLKAGAVGDAVVWDGDPLETTTNIEAVVISGTLQSLESRQTRLRDRYLSPAETERPKAYERP